MRGEGGLDSRCGGIGRRRSRGREGEVGEKNALLASVVAHGDVKRSGSSHGRRHRNLHDLLVLPAKLEASFVPVRLDPAESEPSEFRGGPGGLVAEGGVVREVAVGEVESGGGDGGGRGGGEGREKVVVMFLQVGGEEVVSAASTS